jgi:hypothetical protein
MTHLKIKIAVYQDMMVRKSGCYEFTNLPEEPADALIFNREDGGGIFTPQKNVGKFAPNHMRSCTGRHWFCAITVCVYLVSQSQQKTH